MRNVTPNVLFSSSFDRDITSAPVFSCRNMNTFASYSATYSSRMSSNPCRFAGGLSSVGETGAATALPHAAASAGAARRTRADA